MPTTRPLKVFLCHASADKPAVHKLYRYLKQRGIKPWLDEVDLLPGENWETVIPEAIFDSDVILVCLSKNSVNKEGFVQKEIAFALDKALEKPEGMIFVIPAKLEECDIPQRLKRFQWVALHREDGRKRLMLSLDKRAAQVGSVVKQVVVPDETSEKIEITAIEKTAPEKDELEAKKEVGSAVVDELALEGIDGENAEKVTHEESDRDDTTDILAREIVESKSNEKNAREKTNREAEEKAVPVVGQGLVSQKSIPTYSLLHKISPRLKILGIGLLTVVVLSLGSWGVYQLGPRMRSLTPTEAPLVTKTPSRTPTSLPTKAFTPSLPTETSLLTQPLGKAQLWLVKMEWFLSMCQKVNS